MELLLHPPRDEFAATLPEVERAAFAAPAQCWGRLLADGGADPGRPDLGPVNTDALDRRYDSARPFVEVMAQELGPSLRWSTATTTRTTQSQEPAQPRCDSVGHGEACSRSAPAIRATIAFGEEFLYELKAGPAGGRLRRPSSAGSTARTSEKIAPQRVKQPTSPAGTLNEVVEFSLFEADLLEPSAESWGQP